MGNVGVCRSMAKPQSIPQWQQFLVKWIPVSGTAGLTFFFASSEKFISALISAFCTGAMLLWSHYSSGFMAEAEQEAEKLGGRHAQWLIQLLSVLGRTFTNQIISVLPLPFTTTTQYYEHLEYSYRELKTEGIRLDKPRALENVFVEVHLSARDRLSAVPTGLIRPPKSDEPQDNIGYYLARMPKYWQHRRLAILGAPGSGKTTLMRHVALMYALRTPHRLHPKAPQYLPVLLYLRDICKVIVNDPDVKLATIITDWASNLLETLPLNLPPGWFADQLRRNQCLVMLDGLDEVANTEDRQTVSRWVDRQMQNYPDTPFILTSRPLGYQEAQLQKNIQVLEVQPLTEQQIETFVWNWYAVTERKRRAAEDDVIAQEEAHKQAKGLLAEIKKQPNLSELVSNPLLLTLTAKTYQQKQRIPLKKVELYQTICRVMLGDRQEWKGLVSQLSCQDKLSILQPFALSLMRRETRSFKLAEAESIFTEHLGKLHNSPSTAEFLKQLQAVDALIAKEREGDYEFAHLSFQEYLAAMELKATSQEQDLLAALHSDEKLSWWQETMRFYAAAPQTNSTALVRAILQEAESWQHPNFEKLFLAFDFCREGLVDAAVREQLLAIVNEPLKVLDDADYKIAVELQPRYFKLAHYLQTGQWRAADRETYKVMERVMGGWSLQGIKDFPCQDLRVIDRLWLKYSQGKFGFSVQKQIWVEVGGKLDNGEDYEAAREAWSKVYDVVNWSTIRYELASPKGHLPTWGGVAVGGFAVVGYSPLFSRIQVCRL